MSDLFTTHKNAQSLRRRRHRPSRHRLMKEEVKRSIHAWENRKDKRMAAYRGEEDFHVHETAFAKGLHKPTFDDGEENVEELNRQRGVTDAKIKRESKGMFTLIIQTVLAMVIFITVVIIIRIFPKPI